MTYTSDTLGARDVAAALAGAGFEIGPFLPVERTLLDTFDGRLHAAGIRAEVRKTGDLRLVVTGPGSGPAEVTIERVPAVVGDLPAGPLRARLAPLLDVRALRPTVRVTSKLATATRRNGNGKITAIVDIHDDVTFGSGVNGPTRWAADVIEVEGYAEPARRTVERLTSLGLIPQRGDSFDLAAAETGIDLRGFRDSPTVALQAGAPAGAGFRRVLANLAATIEANRPGTIDDIDSEHLHDLRVAVRRTRSVLSHAKQVLPAEGRRRFGEEFGRLGTVTSPLRDLDVYVIDWPAYVAPLDDEARQALDPVLAYLTGRREVEHGALVHHLRSEEYEGLMAAWLAWLDVPIGDTDVAPKADRPLGDVVIRRIAGAQRQLLSRGRGIGPATAPEELHALRKDAKRLRYLLECFGGLLPAPARKAFVPRLKALQDNLGEHQDTEVHTAQLTAMSRELGATEGVTTTTVLAMGRLAEVFDRRRRAARKEFAARFSAYDTKETASALGALLDSIDAR